MDEIYLKDKIRWIAQLRLTASLIMLSTCTVIKYLHWGIFPYWGVVSACLIEIFLNQPYPFLLKRFRKPHDLLFINQIIDILIITWGIHFLGGMNMFIVVLIYPIVFISKGIPTSTFRTYFLANFAFLAYATLVFLEWKGYIPNYPSVVVWISGKTRLIFLLLMFSCFNITAFIVSGTSKLLRQDDKDLRTSQKRFEDIATHTQEWIWEIDSEGRYTYTNDMVRNIIGYEPEEIIGKHFYDFFVEEARDNLTKEAQKIISCEGVFRNYLKPIVNKNGATIILESEAIPVYDETRRFIGYRGADHDITERKLNEEKLKKLSLAVEQSPAAVMITDVSGNIEYVNPKYAEVTGYSYEETIGRNPRLLKSGYTNTGLYSDMWATIKKGNEWRGEICNRKKNGELFWEQISISPIKRADGDITHFLAVKEDITIKKEYEKRLLRQASYDNLTDLPNRILAIDRISQSIKKAERDNQIVAVMFIDLDQFKLVNDTLGHFIGDEILKETARRLQKAVRSSDTVARFGGDEFLVILPNLDEVIHSTAIAEKILDSFSTPFLIEDRKIFLTASIGITIYPTDGDDSYILLKNSDVAMYKAKEDSRNTFRFFKNEMNYQAAERMRMGSHLRQALKRKELYLLYQPVIDVKTNTCIGAEALLRWENADEGLIQPDRFIPLAEETGLIIPIGEWVIQEACEEASRWRKELGYPVRVSVNVSSRQFKWIEFLQCVAQAIKRSDMIPDYLELEITERLLIDDDPEMYRIINRILEMGVHLAIDDFGKGYSALSYLKKYNFNTLKIDSSFVQDVTHDTGNASLTVAIISMAHNLGLKVTAEGVETQEQCEFLKAHHCDFTQGYYFCKPVTSNEFLHLVKNKLYIK